MRAGQFFLLLGLLLVLFSVHSGALRCYTCMGSTDEDCNRQGSRACPSYSDACVVVRGEGSGVMKSCSYKSFCNQANSHSNSAPGVKVHCCYSNDCNMKGHGNTLSRGISHLLVLPLLWFLFSS